MSDFILALAVIHDVCICVILLKKVNYFLGENRKVIDREQDDDDD